MKDSYSFDRDEAGLEESYQLHIGPTTASRPGGWIGTGSSQTSG